MKTIKIALYKNSKTTFWKIIRFKQRFLSKLPKRYSKYSHVELVFENWLFFSSSEIDWWVRFKKIEPKKNHWDFIEIQVDDQEYKKIYDFCVKQNWNWYNWFWIIFAQTLNLNILRRKWDYFCSEIVSRALQEACFLCIYDSIFISPWKLAFILEENNYLIK